MNPYTQNQMNQLNQSTFPPLGGIVAAGLVGAAITGTIAAAKDIRKVKDGQKERSEATANIAKEALGGGLAVAAGATVAKTLFHSSHLGILAMVAVGVGTKYAYDSFMCKDSCKTVAEKALDVKSEKTAKAPKA